MTLILSHALTDTPVRSDEDINEHIDMAERARETYNVYEEKTRRKLRTMFHPHLRPGAEDPIIATEKNIIDEVALALCSLLHENGESVAQTRFEAAQRRVDRLKKEI